MCPEKRVKFVDPQCSKAVKTTESVRLPFQVVEPYEDDQEALEVIHVIHLNRDNSFQFFCSFFFTDSHFGVVKKNASFCLQPSGGHTAMDSERNGCVPSKVVD